MPFWQQAMQDERLLEIGTIAGGRYLEILLGKSISIVWIVIEENNFLFCNRKIYIWVSLLLGGKTIFGW